MPLDPELRAYLEKQKAQPGALTLEETRAAMRSRASMAGDRIALARVEDVGMGGVHTRLYGPEADEPAPLFVYLHGGRFISGDLESHDRLCRNLAAQTGCLVIAVDYRLAPEHTFPAAVEDAYAVCCWLSEHADEIGGDSKRIAVGGDSAGGNLAAAVALLARGRGTPDLLAQVLIYPMLDATCSLPSHTGYGSGYGPGSEDMKRGWELYIPTGANPKNPLISPFWAEDLSGLPDAFVLTAEYDSLRDEAEEFARKLERAGVPVTLSRYDGAIHGFLQMGSVSALARSAATEAAEYLRSKFDVPIRIPITDVFDLHIVPARDVKAVVEEYLEEAYKAGLKAVRIVHGRGIGVQREIVRSVLARTPYVHSFGDAPAEAGGWGATIVTLR